MIMTRYGTWAVLFVLCVAPRAHAVPMELNEFRTGYVANVSQQLLTYQADVDQLSYLGFDRFDYSNRLCTDSCVPVAFNFNGIFQWHAGVDEDGHVTDAGGMQWLGDFGSGFELLASGTTKRLDPPHASQFTDFNITSFSRLSLVFDLDFVDARVTGIGNQIAFDYEYDIQFRTLTNSLFAQDFSCGPVENRPATGVLKSCSPFSDSGLIGLSVPEP